MAHPENRIPKPSTISARSRQPRPQPRSQNPGIDIDLRSPSHEVGTSLEVFQALLECFEAQVGPLQDWAEDYTLDAVWRNKAMDKIRHKRDRESFESVAAQILGIRSMLKEAVNKAIAVKETWDDKSMIEWRKKQSSTRAASSTSLRERQLSDWLASSWCLSSKRRGASWTGTSTHGFMSMVRLRSILSAGLWGI